MPPSKKHKSSALGEALVSAALEGARKKRRLHEYELHELPRRIENEWKVEKDTMFRIAKNSALAFYVFDIKTGNWCREFQPTVAHVTNALPADLKEMMADPRFNVTVEEKSDPVGRFSITIDAQREFFEANELKSEAEG